MDEQLIEVDKLSCRYCKHFELGVIINSGECKYYDVELYHAREYTCSKWERADES